METFDPNQDKLSCIINPVDYVYIPKEVTYADLKNVPLLETPKKNENMVNLSDPEYQIPNMYIDGMDDTKSQINNESIPVRLEVAQKLIAVNKKLKHIKPDHEIVVTYWFRTLEVQQKKFEEISNKIRAANPSMSLDQILEETHKLIAVPEVSWHPTWGAVDVIIRNTQTWQIVDFGHKIYDWDAPWIETFASVSEEQKEWRMLLRSLMMKQEFVPFDGEWWHFSYWDKERAKYTWNPWALYGQMTVEQFLSLLQ
jgi:D-alanyl-D-alanine dipeptidase